MVGAMESVTRPHYRCAARSRAAAPMRPRQWHQERVGSHRARGQGRARWRRRYLRVPARHARHARARGGHARRAHVRSSDDRRPIAGPVRDYARDRSGSDCRSARRAHPHDLGARSVAPDLHGPAPPTKADLSQASAVTRNALVTDLALAVLAAIVVLILTPGVAVAGMIAILVLLRFVTCFVLDSRRRSSSGARRRTINRRAPPRRRPPARRVRRDCFPCRRRTAARDDSGPPVPDLGDLIDRT